MKDKFVKIVKSRGASGELFTLNSFRRSVNFENNRFKGIDEGEMSGFAVRVKKSGKVGFAYSLGFGDVESVVNAAFDTLEFSKETDFRFSGKSKLPNVKCFDPEIEKENPDSAIELGNEMTDYVRSLKDEIKAGFSEETSIITVGITTTEGFDAEYRKTVKSVSLSGFYTEQGNFLEIFASQARSVNELFDLEILKEKFKTDILASKRNVSIESGTYPVIFTPFAVNYAMLPLLSALNGRSVIHGASLLKGKLSQSVLSPNFTIIDNPLLSGGPYSRPFDDEGVPSARKELISKGQLMNYLSDLETSSKLKIAPGNAERSLTSPPVPASSNLVIQPGDVSVSDMIRIKKGVLIESLMGVSMGNISGGYVTGNVELGFLIENGEITGRIKNAMISFNVFENMKDIAISRENIWNNRFVSPYLYIPGVSVSAK